MKKLDQYRIETKHFVVVVGIDSNGIITMTAPYTTWMKGKTFDWLTRYARKRRWKLQKLNTEKI